jgi:hypothetical protein
MNAPDWAALESIRDANRYSAMCEAGERQAAAEAEQQAAINKACAAIRAISMDYESARQILSTLACTMKACRLSESDVEMVEATADCIG